MGLLSSSSPDKPALDIAIDGHPNGGQYMHATGSSINGVIRLRQCPPQGHRGDMVVTLSGVSKTKIVVSNGQSSVTYRGRAPLLNVHQAVTQHSTAPDGSPEWRFRIPVPHHCVLEGQPPVHHTLISRDSYFHTSWESATPYNTDPRQPVPPSFVDNLNYGLYSSGNYVSYMVVAELHVNTPGADFIHARTPVLLTRGPPPKPPHPHTDHALLTIRSPLLLREHASRSKLSLREKTSALFSPSKQPSFPFLWRATLPSHAALGQPLAIHLSLTPQPDATSAPAPDMVSVEAVSIKARRHLFWRAPRFSAGRYVKRHVDTAREFRIDLPPGSVTPLLAESGWSTTAHTPPLSVAGPSFSTHNIVRAYNLEVEWVLRAAGEKHTLKTCVQGLDVHAPASPAVGGGPAPVPLQQQTVGHGDGGDDDDDTVHHIHDDDDGDDKLSIPPTPPAYDAGESSAAARMSLAAPPGYEPSTSVVGTGDAKR